MIEKLSLIDADGDSLEIMDVSKGRHFATLMVLQDSNRAAVFIDHANVIQLRDWLTAWLEANPCDDNAK